MGTRRTRRRRRTSSPSRPSSPSFLSPSIESKRRRVAGISWDDGLVVEIVSVKMVMVMDKDAYIPHIYLLCLYARHIITSILLLISVSVKLTCAQVEQL